MSKHIGGMRPGPEDLLHQDLIHSQVGDCRKQASEACRLNVERLKLRRPLPPDLAHGAGAGLRKRVRGWLRRFIGDKGRDYVSVSDVGRWKQGCGEFESADRHVSSAPGRIRA
ncbi:hypothetical protein [Methylobacterium sp.]|uniref:hypothetical protein n=1 Tax=Methylobacterium sp. TaxID=409 RepID=UPI0015CBF55E|nr:hypothetical protein [Methylobacterium sp.]